MQHACLRGDDETPGGRDARAPHHLLRGNDLYATGRAVALGLGVVHRTRHATTLGMHEELGVGVLGATLREGLRRQPGMHVTLTEPYVERPARHLAQVVAQVKVRKEQHGNVGR